jgi:hypothetical protein
MWLEIDNQLFNTDHIAAVRPSGLDNRHSIIFTPGQSSADGGFLVKISYKKLSRMLREIRITEIQEYLDAAQAQEDEDEIEEPEPDEDESTRG